HVTEMVGDQKKRCGRRCPLYPNPYMRDERDPLCPGPQYPVAPAVTCLCKREQKGKNKQPEQIDPSCDHHKSGYTKHRTKLSFHRIEDNKKNDGLKLAITTLCAL